MPPTRTAAHKKAARPHAGRRKPRMHPLARAFVRGLLIVLPAAITIWLATTAFLWIDGLLDLEGLIGTHVPGLGFVLALVLTAALGFFGGNFLTHYLFDGIENLFTRTPLVGMVYTSLRDLIDAFVGEHKRFDAPVLIAPFSEAETLLPGFITRKSLECFGMDDHVAVYLPQSYNFAGQLLILPKKRVRPLAADSSAVMAFIVSGGISGAGAEESSGA